MFQILRILAELQQKHRSAMEECVASPDWQRQATGYRIFVMEVSASMDQNYSIVYLYIRNLKGIGLPVFKKKLDKFLGTVADEPLSHGYTAGRRAAPNSLLHMVFACGR